MECTSCKKENRAIARFCKHCGKDLPVQQVSPLSTETIDPDFDSLCGLDDIKARVRRELTVSRNMQRAGKKYDLRQLHAIIIGETGSGKSKLVNELAKIYFRNGITTAPDPIIVQAVNFADFSRNITASVDSARGGILCIENVQQLVSEGYSAGQSTPLDKLNAEMEKRQGDPIVILSSRSQGFLKYLKENPDVSSRFPLKLYLPDFSVDQMLAMSGRILQEEGYITSEAFRDKLRRRFLYLFRNQSNESQTENFARNGFLVQREVKEIIGEHFLNPAYSHSPSALMESDITGELYEVRSTDDIMKDLDDFVGMDGVREFLQRMLNLWQVAKSDAEMTGSAIKIGAHMVLTGNPGTGKTTLARKLGDVFAAAGMLTSGHVVDVDRSKLVGMYKGETAQLVQKYCNEAMGGVLLVDEAYTLKQDSSDTSGQEAIDTLLKRMEDDRGKFIVIAAGYQLEMQRFINANPGMKSRVGDNFFHLPDYDPDQLLEILKIFVKNGGYHLDSAAEAQAAKYFARLYEQRSKDFGNGRDVRIYFETILANRATRLLSSGSQMKDLTIVEADLPRDERILGSEAIQTLLEELDQLTGLEAVKKQVRSLVNFVRLEQRRAEKGGVTTSLNLHFIFKGPPGTGKTTVARIMAKIFHGLGLLPKGQLVEVDRGMLVGEFVGKTALKTTEQIDAAMGGVLFIDEAYALVPKNASNDFGNEAITTLLKRMEDDRGKFIVIAAGYSDDMDQFLAANDGLPSRFSREIIFEDYTGPELTSIFKGLVRGKNMQMNAETEQAVGLFFDDVYAKRDKAFDNGRGVHKIFRESILRQADRIQRLEEEGEDTSGILNLLEIEDITDKKPEPVKTVDEVLFELDQLTGLHQVKKEIRSLVNFIEIEKIRQQAGGESTTLNLHFLFKGRPGTGKTTVARILAKAFRQMGLLQGGQLVEVDRGDLVGEHIGATAPKTTDKINAAIGGVLFIDEAYTLIPEHSPNDFGKEAVAILLKRMEDDRGKFIVIAAGYANDMDQFVASNEGLSSRFTREIIFEDYSGPELLSIFKGMVQRKRLRMSEETETGLSAFFDNMYRNRDKKFANGRTVRNLFENSLRNQSDRLQRQLTEGVDIMNSVNELLLVDIIPITQY